MIIETEASVFESVGLGGGGCSKGMREEGCGWVMGGAQRSSHF